MACCSSDALVQPQPEEELQLSNAATTAAALCLAAMGFGAVHCIMRPTDNYKKSQRTSAGADKWLDTRLWDSTEECLGALKGAGYQIVVTHLSASSITVQVRAAGHSSNLDDSPA